jgi:hypothetical protein
MYIAIMFNSMNKTIPAILSAPINLPKGAHWHTVVVRSGLGIFYFVEYTGLFAA